MDKYFKRVEIPAEIKIKKGIYNPLDGGDVFNYQASYIEKAMAQVVALEDKIICQAIIDAAAEEGFTTVFLIDKEFIISAIKNEIAIREGRDTGLKPDVDRAIMYDRKLSEQQARFDQDLARQHREYNMAVDKLHLTYRQLIKDARQAVMEDIKQHAQHPDGRTVYVITEEQLAEMYERHGVK